VALSSLHDISDYSSYIDQRISKLNNLYQSLTISNDRPHSRARYPPSVNRHSPSLNKHSPALSRQPPQQMREKWAGVSEQMYRTEYLPRRERYHLSDEKEQIYADLKSLTQSHFRNSLDASRSPFPKQEEKRPANKKLEMYKQIKEDILGTFYVGGRTISQRNTLPVGGKQ
jgi:hypothetical protein